MKKNRILTSVISYSCFITLLFLFFSANSLLFASSENVALEKHTEKRKLPHCGLYCIYALVSAWDGDIEFRDLLRPEYISHYEGSSLSELKQAATDNHRYAECVGGMTIRSLKSCNTPAILHVKSSMESKEYDHYVLFLGIKENMARVFTPPQWLAYMPLHKLSYLWDGNALVVSEDPLNISQLFFRDRLLMLSLIVVACIVTVVMHLIRKKCFNYALSIPLKMCYSIAQGSCILITAFILCFVVHFFPDNGFLSYKDAVNAVQKAHAGNFIPKINVNRAAKIIGNGTMFVDARFREDYEAGHIENAISLPIDCTDEEYTQTISSLPKNKRVVLYCQSAGCKYAEIVAIRLREDGFGSLAVFRGGWVEWQKNNESQSAKPEGGNDEENIL